MYMYIYMTPTSSSSYAATSHKKQLPPTITSLQFTSWKLRLSRLWRSFRPLFNLPGARCLQFLPDWNGTVLGLEREVL